MHNGELYRQLGALEQRIQTLETAIKKIEDGGADNEGKLLALIQALQSGDKLDPVTLIGMLKG